MRSIVLLLVIAIAGAAPAIAQDGGLSEADQRRMTFYSEKIVAELHALVAAEQAGSRSSYERHRKVLGTVTERFVLAAGKIGMDDDGAERFFREFFAANFTGRVPAAFANDIGLVSIASVQAGLAVPLPVGGAATDDGDYVNSVRAVGELSFDQ